MWWFYLVPVLLPVSWAKSVSADSKNQLLEKPRISPVFGSCSDANSITVCLKMRSLMLLEDLTVKDAPIHLFGNSLVLVKSGDSKVASRMLPLTERELDSSLPKEETAKEETLDSLISTSIGRFFNSRALQVRLPDLAFLSGWSSLDEGMGTSEPGKGMTSP